MDTNSIIPFEYHDGREVRTITDNRTGDPWWVAKDVCEILGIERAANVVRYLDDDEKNTVSIRHQSKGNPICIIINEPGLYTLILKSRKPEAKKFKRWITHEVIPSIRKRGFYAIFRKGDSLR